MFSDLEFLPHLFCCYFTGLYSRIKDGLFEKGRLKRFRIVFSDGMVLFLLDLLNNKYF